MEGRHSRWSSQPRPRDLLRKIREFALAMIEDLSIGRSPEIFIDRFRNYCTNPDSNWVLLIIQQLLQENRHGSKAWFGTEVILKKFFLKHNNTKPALRGISITCILLYFQVSVGKGYCQCSSVHTCCGERISFYYFYGCFSSQGRGYPDIPTRRFLGLLVDTLHLPIYCLVDCDPYGFDILSMYRFGSMQMVYDAKFLRVPEVLWLGAFPSDSDKYGLPQQCLLHLTTRGKRRPCYFDATYRMKRRHSGDWSYS
ncbi:meiotic recombination protein SPO11-1-like isoform X2 [Malus sylvestris]|uniref:meiotic recombination protein SPO11-1-like isoform X2 n=1 Tax=Malus sylvestris TaxID=3752 RepID=UPI0021AC05CD|nr:meiotic recombination protein SPO11-1-like isoform X2 [Malus sylvestris]